MAAEPTLFHFQGELCRRDGTMGLQGVGLHIRKADYCARAIDISDRQWQGGVLHPEAALFGGGEHEEHPMVLWQMFPKHQASGLACRIGSDLDGDAACSHHQGLARQRRRVSGLRGRSTGRWVDGGGRFRMDSGMDPEQRRVHPYQGNAETKKNRA